MKRAVIYVRESTNFQDPESQMNECINYCKKHNLEIVKTYQDIASGKNNTRKGFLQMLQDMEDDVFDVIVLWELSRSTRDFMTYKTMIMRMTELGKNLHSLQEGILTENNIDRELSNDVKALINSFERKQAARRSKFRKKYIKSEGYWTGGVAPLGYYSKDKNLYIIPEEAAKVLEIFHLFISGISRTEIGRKFGLDPKKINRILVNPIYIGKLKMNETEIINDKRVYHKDYEVVAGRHEAIIDEETFKLSVALSKKKRREKYKTDISILPLVYWHTGEKMYPLIGNKSQYKIYYQAENSYAVVGLDYLEKTVLKGLINDLDKIKILNNVGDNSSIDERKEFYQNEIKKIKLQQKRLLKKNLDNIIDDDTFCEFNKDFENKLKEFNKSLVEIEKLQLNKSKRENNIKTLKEYLELLKNTQDRHELKKILNIIISEIRMVNNFRPVIITNIF